ncbi:MAG: helix-turn-helix transcriptional regulator [Bacteroidales bacterium]
MISIDLSSMVIVWSVFGLYKLGKIGFKLSSAVLCYTTFTNLIISHFFFCYNAEASLFTNVFLIDTIVFCANIAVVGFCVGNIHLFISGAYYIVAYISLLIISHDAFLVNNAFVLITIILAFSFGFSAFLSLLNKMHKEELDLKQELHEKEGAVIREREEKLHLELELKQKELATKALFILKQVENNNSFISKLKELKEQIKVSGLKQFYAILSEHEMIQPENFWKEFEISFQEVHNDFYKNLQLHFPDLTPAERRMAAFIRLDLSTKQIADITSNSIHSIEVARSRLRKKLNMDTQNNLKDFLNNY